ncbi:MAG: YqaA family protein [Arcobacteraceae bacterium]|jgi:membrane protein YqaA with SNARE-associated domain
MQYIYLFFISFISATVFPLGSEALFLYDLSAGLDVSLLLILATVGNTLGSYINYWLGLKGEVFLANKNLIKEAKIKKAKIFFDKYGGITLLFSWAPLVGDAFTFAAGALQYNKIKFIILVTIAKFGRYVFLFFAYYYFIS